MRGLAKRLAGKMGQITAVNRFVNYRNVSLLFIFPWCI